MALATSWDQVIERFRDLERYQRLRPTIAAMLALVRDLRRDPGMADVEPSVSLASLNLKLQDSLRYVMVGWAENESQPFTVAFVDPPLEFHDTQKVSEPQVVATTIDYIDRLRRCSPPWIRPR